MGKFTPKTYATILEAMVNRVIAKTALTDLNDGSSLKQILAAAARSDDDIFFQMLNLLSIFDIDKATGLDLDERAKEFNPGLIARLPAAKAVGEVVFSRTGTSGVVTIAIGTQVQVPASDGNPAIIFVTTETGTIADLQQNSNAVSVICTQAGTKGNVAVGTLVGFVSKPSGVDTVTNQAAFTNGTDLESDDHFRNRLKQQIRGLARSHISGLEAAAFTGFDTVTGKSVVFAQVVEDPFNLGNVTLYIDDGAGTAGVDTVSIVGESVILNALGGETVTTLAHGAIVSGSYEIRLNTVPMVEGTDYVINLASGQINFVVALTAGDDIDADYDYYAGIIGVVQKIIDGDPADRANYPGYRAAGVLVRVLSPSIRSIVVTANITVLNGFSQTAVATQVEQALSAYVNGLGISEDVVLNEMRERAMGVAGMYDIEFMAPTENVVILDNEIARLTSGNTTIT